MAERGEAVQIVNNEAGDSSNGRDALRRQLADINHRACESESEIIRQKTAYEADPDNRADNFAYHLKACRRVLHSLQEEYANFHHGDCICDNFDPVCEGFCPAQDMVEELLSRLKELIWDCWLNDLKERGERHSMLREAIKVVEGLPVFKMTEDHLDEALECASCKSNYFEIAEEACHLPCNKGHIFHKDCIERLFKSIADIDDQACDLRSEITRQKATYEADPENQADNFAFQLNINQEVLESLQGSFYFYEVDIDNCICDNPSPECKQYRDPLKRVKLIFVGLKDLIQESWSSDLRGRVERQMEREIRQVVEGLPYVKITGNHINEDIVCAICLSDPEIADNPCHLPCDEGHIFHRNCIERWLNRKNQCPMCRRAAYRPKLYFYPEVIKRLQTLGAAFVPMLHSRFLGLFV